MGPVSGIEPLVLDRLNRDHVAVYGVDDQRRCVAKKIELVAFAAGRFLQVELDRLFKQIDPLADGDDVGFSIPRHGFDGEELVRSAFERGDEVGDLVFDGVPGADDVHMADARVIDRIEAIERIGRAWLSTVDEVLSLGPDDGIVVESAKELFRPYESRGAAQRVIAKTRCDLREITAQRDLVDTRRAEQRGGAGRVANSERHVGVDVDADGK